MNVSTFFLYLAVMALVTYLVRALPFVLMKKKVKNLFFKSFLTYIPYTVLAAMTFPAILSATQTWISALAGCVVAVVLAYFGQSLVKVALGACAMVLVIESMMFFIN